MVKRPPTTKESPPTELKVLVVLSVTPASKLALKSVISMVVCVPLAVAAVVEVKVTGVVGNETAYVSFGVPVTVYEATVGAWVAPPVRAAAAALPV
jgi:hypothetical protein